MHQRPTVEREIARIVDQFVADRGVDAIDLGPRRRRVEQLHSIASFAESIRRELELLNPTDRLRIGVELDPELSAIELVRVPLDQLLDRLGEAAELAAQSIPGALGGRVKSIAAEHLAQLCLRLFLRYRPRELSLTNKDGFVDFLQQVHALASQEEIDLDRPARDAVEAMRSGTGLFGLKIRDKT